ncbi:MAG: IS630 family transposase, partial [Nitrosopumilaceae archaeon]|nr:IS630 family transposase [Nitrosopumilaceae archaeon]
MTSEERKALQKRHRIERDGRVRDRIKAVLAYDDGYSYSEIAKILLLDDSSIRRHVFDYFSQNKLKPKNGGSVSLLTAEESLELKSHLRLTTYLYVKEICAYVAKAFNKTYSISGMTHWLQSNGFRYKKPHGLPAKADPASQQEFISEYQELKQSLGNKDIIYFVDSCHPQHQTRLAYGWIEKGVRKSEKMTACQKRVNLMGAINLNDHNIQYASAEKVNTESIRKFLEQLMAANPNADKIHIIWDNAGYHKSQEIINFIKSTKITLHYLPPYSPNLNSIERLWKIMHENVTYNKYYAKFSEFKGAIFSFFEKISDMKDILKSRINDNFQTL